MTEPGGSRRGRKSTCFDSSTPITNKPIIAQLDPYCKEVRTQLDSASDLAMLHLSTTKLDTDTLSIPPLQGQTSAYLPDILYPEEDEDVLEMGSLELIADLGSMGKSAGNGIGASLDHAYTTGNLEELYQAYFNAPLYPGSEADSNLSQSESTLNPNQNSQSSNADCHVIQEKELTPVQYFDPDGHPIQLQSNHMCTESGCTESHVDRFACVPNHGIPSVSQAEPDVNPPDPLQEEPDDSFDQFEDSEVGEPQFQSSLIVDSTENELLETAQPSFPTLGMADQDESLLQEKSILNSPTPVTIVEITEQPQESLPKVRKSGQKVIIGKIHSTESESGISSNDHSSQTAETGSASALSEAGGLSDYCSQDTTSTAEPKIIRRSKRKGWVYIESPETGPKPLFDNPASILYPKPTARVRLKPRRFREACSVLEFGPTHSVNTSTPRPIGAILSDYHTPQCRARSLSVCSSISDYSSIGITVATSEHNWKSLTGEDEPVPRSRKRRRSTKPKVFNLKRTFSQAAFELDSDHQPTKYRKIDELLRTDFDLIVNTESPYNSFNLRQILWDR